METQQCFSQNTTTPAQKQDDEFTVLCSLGVTGSQENTKVSVDSSRKKKKKKNGSQSCLTLCSPIDGSPTNLLCPWDSPDWSGLPFPPPGDLPDPGIAPGFPALQTDSLLYEPPGKPHFFLEPQIT